MILSNNKLQKSHQLTRQSNLLQAIHASRKRRGVVGEEQDEELLRNGGQADGEEGEENGDFTQPGSHVETTNGRIWTPRGANSIPPAPLTHAAKIALIPSGDRNWLEAQFNKKDRVPNTILGALLRHYYPQIVMDTSKTPPLEVAATKWRHWYMRGPDADTSAEPCADKVKNAFMARYKWPDDQPEMKDKWMKTLENCCTKLTTQLIYQVRIYAVMAYHAEVLHRAIRFDDAKVIHLESNEYRRVPFGTWVNTEPWFKLSDMWGSRQLKNISTVKRNARLSKPDAVNRGGSRSIARTQQCMEAKYGRPFSLIESFAVHMGATKEAVAQGQGNELPPLRNENAQEHLDNYRSGMMETYGPDVSWVRGPFDPQVMYDNTGRKPHGKFAIADGAFDSSKVQMSTIACPSHSQTSSQNEVRLAQEVQELQRQRQQDQQQRQEDRQSMLSAFIQFNQQVSQYYGQGETHLPPPQLSLASIFPTHGSPGAEQDGMNNSTNGGTQQQGGNNSMYTPQDDPTSSQYMNDASHENYNEEAELERWFGPSITRI